jgi:hypothetical protein
MAMKKEHVDMAVIIVIATILFGGMHLINHKRLDGNEGYRAASIGPAAGYVHR